MERFRDRSEAGKLLAARLTRYANRRDVLILGLPRGGVPIAFEIAQALHVPLDVMVVRKLGVPGREELAMGAIATGSIRILNKDVVLFCGISNQTLDHVTAHEQQELERREHSYRGERPVYIIQGRSIILVDDGIATGATMRAAIAALKQQHPARIIVAVPVAASTTYREMAREVDEMICLLQPEEFYAVGLWYENFTPTSDEEVRELLDLAAQQQDSTSQMPQNSQNA